MNKQHMSLLSLTPQKKLHNYLQRIDKLLNNNNRSKSPIHTLSKSRISTVKSSIGIKTTNIDKYLEYEKNLKFFMKFIENHNRNLLKYTIGKLKQNYKQNQASSFSEGLIINKQSVNFFKKNDNDNQKFKIIILTIKTQIIKQLSFGFNQIKLFQINNSPLKNNHLLYSSRRSNQSYNNLTKNYSSIYLETLRKNLSKNKSTVKYEDKGHFQSKYSEEYLQKQRNISPFQQYMTRTPERYEKIINSKKVQPQKNRNKNNQLIYTKLITKILKSKYYKILHSGFQKLKYHNFYQQILQRQRFTFQKIQKQLQTSKSQHQIKQKSLQKYTNQLQYYKKQLQTTTLSIIQFKKVINDQNQTIELLNQRINKILKQNQVEKMKKCDNELLIKEYHETNNNKQSLFQRNQLSKKSYQSSKIVNMNMILSFKLKLQLKNTFQKIKFQSVQLFKNQKNQDQLRTTNPRSVIYTADLNNFAEKINKAFQLKSTLKKVYLNVFQQIDRFAFQSITLSSPFQKIIKRTLSQSLKQMKFFILSKCENQQKSFNKQKTINNLNQLKQCERQAQKLTNYLKKIDNKILYSKIDAYTEIKLFNSFKSKDNNQSFLNQDTLKRQIKQFFEQRQRISQKTLNSWNRTKQILEEQNYYQSRVQ